MALNYDELSAITNNYIVPKLVDNIFTSNTLLARARKKWYNTRSSGGDKILVPVAYATTSASAWYDGAETLTITANDQLTSAEFDWKQIHSAITITGRDEAINSGKEAIVNFVRSKIQLAEGTITQNLGTALYNLGTDAKAIVGLRLAIDSAGTYGGIDRSSYSWFAAQEDSSTTTLSMALLQGLFGDCTQGNSHPTVIPCTQDIYDLVWNKVQPQQRFQDRNMASSGFQSILFNGVPIVVDNHCPASHLFMINEQYIQFIVHANRNFKFVPFVKPTNQDTATAHILWMGALCVSNPRMMGKLGAITA